MSDFNQCTMCGGLLRNDDRKLSILAKFTGEETTSEIVICELCLERIRMMNEVERATLTAILHAPPSAEELNDAPEGTWVVPAD